MSSSQHNTASCAPLRLISQLNEQPSTQHRSVCTFEAHLTTQWAALNTTPQCVHLRGSSHNSMSSFEHSTTLCAPLRLIPQLNEQLSTQHHIVCTFEAHLTTQWAALNTAPHCVHLWGSSHNWMSSSQHSTTLCAPLRLISQHNEQLSTQHRIVSTFQAPVAVDPISNEASQQQNETSTREAKDCSEQELTTRQMNEVQTDSKVPHTISLQHTQPVQAANVWSNYNTHCC